MNLKLAGLLTLTVILAGCQTGPTEKDFVGSWSSPIIISDAELLAQIKKMGASEKDLPQAKMMIGQMKAKLELKADKTYSLGQVMGDGAAGSSMGEIEGKWTFADKKISLNPEKLAGMSKDEFVKKNAEAKDQVKQMTLDIDKDGKTLTGSGPATGGFKFTRVVAEKK